ncbi:MAG: serine/threonine protein kinase [Phycisphaerae bacterium]|nr:serine/threonine protein kinase [Phycisphaerae bacterium]
MTTLRTVHVTREQASEAERERQFPSFSLPLALGPIDANGEPTYTVLSQVGHGQSARVYRGVFHRLSSHDQTCNIAVKFFREITNDRHAEEARREALRADLVRDDHVVRVRDVGLWQDRWPYVIHDFHQAQNLEEWAAIAFGREGAAGAPGDAATLPTIERCVRIVLDATRGVEAAHAKDVIHRDIAPRNLLVCADGVTRITDFGCASLGERSGDTIVVGTPGFMPPEQWTNGAHLRQSDIASLAGVLFWLITGRLPYGETSEAVAQAHAEPERAHAMRADVLTESDVPPEIATAILKATEPSLLKRTDDARTFAAALERWLAAPVEGSTASAGSPPTRLQRRRGPLVLASILFLALVVFVAFWNGPRGPMPLETAGQCSAWFDRTPEDPAFLTLARSFFQFSGLKFEPQIPPSIDREGALELAWEYRSAILGESDFLQRFNRTFAVAVLAYEARDDDATAWWLATSRDMLLGPEAASVPDLDMRICQVRWNALQGLRWYDAELAMEQSPDGSKTTRTHQTAFRGGGAGRLISNWTLALNQKGVLGYGPSGFQDLIRQRVDDLHARVPFFPRPGAAPGAKVPPSAGKP